jgi:PKD repeat protein
MKIKQTMGIVLISVILLSATALAATPADKPVQKLKADFTATIDPKMPMKVKFTDKSTGSPTKWAWNFGDKSPIVKTKNATHIYKKAGKYTVTLTVMKGKEMSKKSKVINIKMKKM